MLWERRKGEAGDDDEAGHRREHLGEPLRAVALHHRGALRARAHLELPFRREVAAVRRQREVRIARLAHVVRDRQRIRGSRRTESGQRERRQQGLRVHGITPNLRRRASPGRAATIIVAATNAPRQDGARHVPAGNAEIASRRDHPLVAASRHSWFIRAREAVDEATRRSRAEHPANLDDPRRSSCRHGAGADALLQIGRHHEPACPQHHQHGLGLGLLCASALANDLALLALRLRALLRQLGQVPCPLREVLGIFRQRRQGAQRRLVHLRRHG